MTAALAQQRELQLRHSFWSRAGIATATLLGFGLSALGLLAARTLSQHSAPLSGLRVGFLWFGLLYFGVALALLVTAPLRLRPRIVPCFRRQLADYGGPSSAAFGHGHGLYRELAALDALAQHEQVEPLSAFGFADDSYGQQVRWHAAAAGVRTVEALRVRAADTFAADVTADLVALAAVLEIAAARGAEFSLRLRLQRGDLQEAATSELRDGRFW